MKVRAGSIYAYRANSWDRFDSRTCLRNGELVRVVNMHGCPKANTMGHCHVQRLDGQFIGLVCTASMLKVRIGRSGQIDIIEA